MSAPSSAVLTDAILEENDEDISIYPSMKDWPSLRNSIGYPVPSIEDNFIMKKNGNLDRSQRTVCVVRRIKYSSKK